MQLQFVGCGDAFGSGGRFNTCFHVTDEGVSFLLDCGASSLIAMKRLGIAPNTIDTILVTHFHADHFGGIPFFILDAQFFSKRTSPLTLAGPPGLEDRYLRVMEASFPSSAGACHEFDIIFRELANREECDVNGLVVTPFLVNHGNPGGPSFAYRIAVNGKVLAYTGDTDWTDVLAEAGRDVDLFIAEAYFRDKAVKLHLDLATLERHLPEICPKRLVLTHMSPDVLDHLTDIAQETAEDGKVVEF
jgi:ribonuclease BN (tRNA processing enzyme)